MAANGSVATNSYKNWDLIFSWEETAQSAANNTTTISWELAGGGAADGYVYAQNIKAAIDGQAIYTQPSGEQIQLRVGTVIAGGVQTIAHDSDGTKSFTVYVEAGVYNWEVNCTARQTFELDAIQRGLVYIDNGSGWDRYQCYVDNGSGWDVYAAYVDNGSGWELCG